MRELLKYLKGDSVIWIITLIMLGFSMVSVYSFVPILVKIEGGSPTSYLFKHVFYVLIGFGVMYWIHKKNPKYISQLAKFGFVLGVALLIFTFFFGAKVNDAGRWIKIPFVGITFQSSDFAKLSLIIFLSRMLVKKKDQLNQWKNGYLSVMFPVALVCVLILKDNFSTAALIFLICMVLMFVAKVPLGKMVITIAAIVGVFLLIVIIHKALPDLNVLPRYETWENRLLNKYQNPEDNLSNAQSLIAKDAIYNGSLIGKGVGDGELKSFLPEAYADFFYASFVEEFGLIAAILLVFLYLILFFRIIRIGTRSESLFETYTCIGIGILIISQASINMLVCTGIFPVTGQNMPLLAMGGSAMVMTCVSLGIVQSIAYQQSKGNDAAVLKNIDNNDD